MTNATTIRNPKTGMILSDYDQILLERSDHLIKKFREKDLQQKRPVDRTGMLLVYGEFCICKLYGIQKFHKEDNNPFATKILYYLYSKVTQLDCVQSGKNLGINKMRVWRSIDYVNNLTDDLQLKKIKYITEKLQAFYKNINHGKD